MENSKIMMKEKLGFFEIIKESLKIPFKNPYFIIFTFLTSLPLYCSLLIFEILLQQTLIETGKTLQVTTFPDYIFSYGYTTLENIEIMEIGKVSRNFLLLGVLYLGIIHFLDLFNTIAAVDMASMIYTGEKVMDFKDMIYRLIKETRLEGPVMTSIHVLLLDSLVLLGLVSLAAYIFITSSYVSFMMLFVVLFIALLTKYMEWSAVWNMGIVISVLEQKQSDVALVVSAYLSRGSRQCGLLFMLVFSAWRLTLRLSCLYMVWAMGGRGLIAVTTVHISLVCLANVWKWVAFMVYFYDCKTQSSEKKIDVEQGSTVKE